VYTKYGQDSYNKDRSLKYIVLCYCYGQEMMFWVRVYISKYQGERCIYNVKPGQRQRRRRAIGNLFWHGIFHPFSDGTKGDVKKCTKRTKKLLFLLKGRKKEKGEIHGINAMPALSHCQTCNNRTNERTTFLPSILPFSTQYLIRDALRRKVLSVCDAI
jgi:hypothetical protein